MVPSSSPNLEYFKRAGELTAGSINLSEGALMVAQWNYPDLDVHAELRKLDELAQLAAARVGLTTTLPERIAALVRFLSEEQKFRGNIEEYYDPANTFLNDVLARRCGLPISLAVVYIHVARFVGVELSGVATPGHFVTRAELVSGVPIFVDPFYGLILSEEELRARYRTGELPAEELPPEVLQPVDNRRILIRMLTNLKHLYVAQDDVDRALECCERSLALDPNSRADLRDRGLMLLDQELFTAGIADLSRYLEMAPNEPWSAAVRERLTAAQRLMDTLN
jgi:regulator of sirC expression with transglutaminase-like and TPR domain